jgi:hypothetical protein
VHWEHWSLTAQADLLGFSLCLRITSHRKSQGMRWQHQSPLSREAGSGAVGHATLWSPPLQGSRIRSCRTRGAPELSPVGRRGPKLWYMWWRWSPFYQGGGIRSHWTHDSPGAHLGWDVGSVLQGTWRHVDACPTSYLDLKLLCRSTRSAGCRQCFFAFQPKNPTEKQKQTWPKYFFMADNCSNKVLFPTFFLKDFKHNLVKSVGIYNYYLSFHNRTISNLHLLHTKILYELCGSVLINMVKNAYLIEWGSRCKQSPKRAYLEKQRKSVVQRFSP